MPDNRRIQGPETSVCPLFYLPDEEKSSAKPLLKSDGTRRDGRKNNEIRSLFLNTGINPQATGSAYLEMGNTKVLCTIYGPKELPRREDVTAEGQLTCEFKFAPFSCLQRRQHQQDQQEKDYSSVIVQALRRAIRVEIFPRLQLEMSVMILENGGSALAASIVCASLALADSGIEILDLPIACSLSLHHSEFLLDPSLDEEFMGDEVIRHPDISGEMTVVYLPALDEVTAMKQMGAMDQQQITKGLEMCVEGCLRIHQKMRDFITEQVTAELPS